MMQASPVSATVDFEQEGLQHGHLKLAHSHDASAWGSLMIPITVARNGAGPTVLLTGGNHGDEYEGPIALYDLAASLDPATLQGRVIIIPAMNYPAFRAGTRTSPIDKGNMNRVFPGSPTGTITEKIADYFQRHLIPMADLVVDIHSGGKTLEFVPFCAAHRLANAEQDQKNMAALAAFNAPYTMSMLEIDSVGMYDTAVEGAGKTFLTTELAGGGTARPETIAVAKKGVCNILKHAGVLPGALEIGPTVRLDMPDDTCFIPAQHSGLLEFCVELGASVRAGDVIACIHDVERTGEIPQDYKAAIDGVLAGRHFPGLITMGDVVAVIAIPVEEV